MRIKLLTIFLVLQFTALCLRAQSPLQFTKEEQEVWDNRADEINIPTCFMAEDILCIYTQKYQMSPEIMNVIRNYCYNKEIRKYTHNYTQRNPEKRLQEKAFIDSVFQDSIDCILIPHNHQIAGVAISYTLSISKYLNMENCVYDSLMNKAIVLARIRHIDPCAFTEKDEMDALKHFLSSEQLRKAINWKNAKEARHKATETWNALSRKELTSELDSIKESDIAFLYYQKELFYRDFFVGENEILSNNLNDLYLHRPPIIRMYEGISKKEQVKKKYEEKVSPTFSW